MSTVDEKNAQAWELAQRHYQIEPGIKTIVRLSTDSDVEESPSEPIKLLEVNENTVPSGVMPIQFGPEPSSGFDYPSVIVELTPEEYAQLQRHELKLPKGWIIGETIPRSEESSIP